MTSRSRGGFRGYDLSEKARDVRAAGTVYSDGTLEMRPVTGTEPRMVLERPKPEEREGFPSIVRRLSGYAYAMALKALGNRSDAEDAVQEAFLKLHRAFEGGLAIGDPSAYLVGIQRNVIADALERRRRLPPLAGDCPEDARPVGGRPDSGGWRMEEILEAVRRLPEPQGEIVLMKHLEGRTISEIASALGRTEDSVRGLLFRGMEALRGALSVESGRGARS